MEILNIAVVSSDKAYNRTFSAALLHCCRQIEVSIFTCRQFMERWKEYGDKGDFCQSFDIILWAGSEIADAYGDNIVFLTDRKSLTSMDYGGRKFAIYKYSPASVILSYIFDIYASLTGRKMTLVKRHDIKLFAFASPMGGAGTTTISRAVCQELARFYEKRVLYLSLEDIDSSRDYLKIPDGIKSEGELLYRLLGRSGMPFLDAYLVKDDFGVCSFVPPEGRNPLRELSGTDMQSLLSDLMNTGAFDVIISDVSTSLTEAAMAVMEPAERICLISRGSYAEARMSSCRKQLAGCMKDSQSKIITVENFAHGDGAESTSEFKIRRIPEEAGLQIAAPLEGILGQDVSILTAELIHMVK